MVRYTISKPSSTINPEWIFWSQNDFKRNLAPDKTSSVVFETHKKEILVVFMPTPVIDKDELAYTSEICLTRAVHLPFSKLIQKRSDLAAPSSSTRRFPPSSIPKSPSSPTQSMIQTGRMPRWRLHSSQSPPLLQSPTELRSKVPCSTRIFRRDESHFKRTRLLGPDDE